jgi:hypothetical protein
MRFYLAVTKSKTRKVIVGDFSYENCKKLGKLLCRGREFEIVERYLVFDNYRTILQLMEGCLIKHIDFVICEQNAHLPD